MFPFEFVVVGTPLSHQAKNKRRLQAWKEKVKTDAESLWIDGNEPSKDRLTISITYYYEGDTPDVDNIIKPIQDALIGLVYEDDNQIVSTKSTKKDINGSYKVRNMSLILAIAFSQGDDFLHIKIDVPHNEEVLE